MPVENMNFRPFEPTREKPEESPEIFEARHEGERIYSEEFAAKLDDVLRHEFRGEGKNDKEPGIVLKDILDKHLRIFSSPEFADLSDEERAEKQKEFVLELGRGINSIPGQDPWSFYFKRIMERGRINCSGSATLLGMVLENTKDKSGIKNIEYGHPYGHAFIMITFGDGRLYLVDARNGMFEDISDYTTSKEKDSLKVYKINQPEEKTGFVIPWRHVPVTSVKEGVIGAYSGNLESAYDAASGKFDKALKMGHSKKELEEIQKAAQGVCREREFLSAEQLSRSKDVTEFFIGKVRKHEKSQEFRKEIRRLKKLLTRH